VNKKKQKNFFDWDVVWSRDVATRKGLANRSFLLLFFKKEALPSYTSLNALPSNRESCTVNTSVATAPSTSSKK
jgi:hypothetical protein